MPKKTKEDEADEQEKTLPEKSDEEADGNWSRDQREKSYYYDDSYGYEVYNPDDEEDED